MDERVRELTKELMVKSCLIDQLSSSLEKLQNEKMFSEEDKVQEAPTVAYKLHKQIHLTNLLTHSLITTRRVLNQQTQAHDQMKSTVANCFLGLESDMKELLGGVSRYQGQAEGWKSKIERESIAGERDRLELERERLSRERVEGDLEQCKAELEGGRESLKDKDAMIADLESKLNALQVTIDRFEDMQEEAGNDCEKLTKALDEERALKKKAEEKNRGILGDLELTRMNLEQLEEKLEVAREEARSSMAESAELQGLLNGLEAKADGRIGDLTKEVNSKSTELERVREELSAELKDARNSARTAAQKREEAMQLLEDRLDAANLKISDLNALLQGEREGRGDGEKAAGMLQEEWERVTA
jgi:chromosome segregation ATPase